MELFVVVRRYHASLPQPRHMAPAPPQVYPGASITVCLEFYLATKTWCVLFWEAIKLLLHTYLSTYISRGASFAEQKLKLTGIS